MLLTELPKLSRSAAAHPGEVMQQSYRRISLGHVARDRVPEERALLLPTARSRLAAEDVRSSCEVAATVPKPRKVSEAGPFVQAQTQPPTCSRACARAGRAPDQSGC